MRSALISAVVLVGLVACGPSTTAKNGSSTAASTGTSGGSGGPSGAGGSSGTSGSSQGAVTASSSSAGSSGSPGTTGAASTSSTTGAQTTGTSSSAGTTTGSSAGTTGTTGVCAAQGFDSASVAWAIPHPANVLSNGYHTVVDLDGDGKSDFVQYDIESTSTDAAIGQTKWLLFKNTGSGFAATGTDWPIPHPANTFANGYHAVVDMNHDGLPDYVQYDVESTSTDAAIGQTEWLVFLNTGSGFSSSPLHWPIPHAANTFANGYHAVVDMDGDGLPDYVQYDLESTSTDSAIGQTKWLVFKNTGTGFASTGQDWSIPHPANVLSNGYHAVLDMDGDHRPDFIQYDLESTSTDPNIGQSKWLLFRNTGSGFSSTSADWAIPHPANVLSNGYHAVLDMDGDGLPDYVQYDLESTSTDSAIGQTKWLLFKGSGAGFASAGQDWAIPHPANVLSNGYHAVLDLQPDGHVDFVQYDLESTSTDPDIGQSKWLVFPGVCHP